MIELIKVGNISFHLNMDMLGTEKMIEYIENMNCNNNGSVLEVMHLGKNKRFLIEVNDYGESLSITNQIIKIEMDDDEIEYFKQRLQECLISKSFYPAELCERYLNNKYISIYVSIVI